LSIVCARKIFFKNSLIFGEDMKNDKVGRFWGHSV